MFLGGILPDSDGTFGPHRVSPATLPRDERACVPPDHDRGEAAAERVSRGASLRSRDVRFDGAAVEVAYVIVREPEQAATTSGPLTPVQHAQGQVITRRTALRADLRKRCSAHRSALSDYGSEGWGFDSLPARQE